MDLTSIPRPYRGYTRRSVSPHNNVKMEIMSQIPIKKAEPVMARYTLKAITAQVCGRPHKAMDFKINKELLLLKVLMFLWWGDFIMVVPLLLVHMKQVGLSVSQTMTIFTCLPIFQFCSQPLLGILADKTKSYKGISTTLLVLFAVTTTAVFFVPSSLPPEAKGCAQNNETIMGINSSQQTDPPGTVSDVSKSELLDRKVEVLSLVIHNATQSQLEESSGKKGCNETATEQPIVAFNEPANHEADLVTFGTYFALRVVIEVTSQSIFTIFESSALVMVSERQASYGRQRFWAIVGSGILPFIGSFSCDAASSGQGQINFTPLYCISNVIILLILYLNLKLDLKLVSPPKNVLKSIKIIASSRTNIVFLIVLVCLGTMWGYSEVFILLYMKQLNSPTYLFGMTFLVSTVCGLPMLFMSDWFIQKIGHVPLLIACFGVYAVRFIGYSVVKNAALCLIFEAMELMTYHLFWVVAVTYSIMLTPPELMATVQGTIGSAHYAVGSGLGSLFGGLLLAKYTYQTTYQIMAGCSVAGGLVYTLYYCLDKRSKKTSQRSAAELPPTNT